MPFQPPIRILLVEDNPVNAEVVTAVLRTVSGFRHELRRAESLKEAISLLNQEPFDVVLLDIFLPDSEGENTVRKMCEALPAIAVVVLTALECEDMGLRAVQLGAQDYLEKNRLEGRLLVRTIRHAIERHRLRSDLLSLSLLDSLTGIYNRRGFLMLAKQRMAVDEVGDDGLLSWVLLYGDLDGLKAINDNYGHAEGDFAIQTSADTLRTAFPRSGDLIARIGGDEFVVLTRLEATATNPDALLERVSLAFASKKGIGGKPYALGMSMGAAVREGDGDTIEAMMSRADEKLYQVKQLGKVARK